MSSISHESQHALSCTEVDAKNLRVGIGGGLEIRSWGNGEHQQAENAARMQTFKTLVSRTVRGFLPGGMQAPDNSGLVETLYPTVLARSHGDHPYTGVSPWPLDATPPWRNAGVDVVRCFIEQPSLRVKARAHRPPEGCELCHRGAEGGFEYEVELAEGAYAVVRCANEALPRPIKTQPALLGRAGGHVTLACERPVLFAGEVQLDRNAKIIAWTLVSGTYQLPDSAAAQSTLPPSLLWRFIEATEVPKLPEHAETLKLPGGHALLSPTSGPAVAIKKRPTFNLKSRPTSFEPIELDSSPESRKRPCIDFPDTKAYTDHVISTYMPNPPAPIELDHQSDKVNETDGYSDIIDSMNASVDTVTCPPANLGISPKQRLALIIIRWLCLAHSYEKTVLNDCILSKLLLGEEARAHIDGIYVTVYGVRRRQTQFTLKHVREITHVLVLTRSYLAVLNANKIEQNWENAVSFWTSQAGIQVLSRGDNYDHTIAESEESTTWLTRLKTSMRYQSDCVGTESKLDRIISNMVNYFQTPRT